MNMCVRARVLGFVAKCFASSMSSTSGRVSLCLRCVDLQCAYV